MNIRNLAFMMQPASIALVVSGGGADDLARIVLRNLLKGGFSGEIHAVCAESVSLEGVTIRSSLECLSKPPDLAVVITEPDSIATHLSRLGALGAKTAVVFTGEPAGTGGAKDQRLQLSVQEAVKSFPMRIVGLGSVGILSPTGSLNASLAHVQPFKGKLAFVSQSGAVLSTVLDWATERKIGFSHLVALGTMVDVDFGDVLDYLADDRNTLAILVHLESVAQARKFMSAARLAARLKPVIVLKGGLHAEWGCATSTSRPCKGLIDSDAVYHAAFRRAGMLRVYDLRDLFRASETLSKVRTMPGDRLAILTNGRGVGVLATDGVISEGARLAELSLDSHDQLNRLIPGGWSGVSPVDLRRDASGYRYAQALEILLDDKGVDAVLALHCPGADTTMREVAQAVVEAVKKRGARPRGDRVLTSWLGDGTAAGARRLFMEGGIPTYETPGDAVRGFMQVVRYRRNQEMLMETPPSIPQVFSPDSGRVLEIVKSALGEDRALLSESEVREVLGAYDIPIQVSTNREESFELLIGVSMDVQFGPVIRFGHGGAAAEFIQDTALALPPLNLHLARDLMSRTRTYRLLETMGDADAPILQTLALILVKVSQLICDIAAITELEINPLWVNRHTVWVGRAGIRVSEVAAPGVERLAIRPYPKELEENVSLPDGKSLLLRPIRPEDEPAYQRLFDRLPPEDIFFRFMNPMKALSHSLGARLTQLDYDREMALVLIAEETSGVPELCGGVRISADADNDRAEFAILLRRDMTGLGLGPLMMRRIIEYARSRSIREVYGEVLSDNTPMLKLCKALGFSTRRMMDDPNIIIASLDLTRKREPHQAGR